MADPIIYILGVCPSMFMKRAVVLGAHPDDAESGCGGLIANLTERGVEVEILCMTRGEKAPGENPPG